MSLNEKLKMLNLSKEQEKIATDKFMASLALVTLDEFTESFNYLQSQGVTITKANQIKVLTNLCHDLTKKFSVLGETKETDIYRQEPNMLNKNVIDVYRRFQKCNQDGINYKNDDGTYKSFIFTEKGFQKELASKKVVSKPVVENDTKITFEPVEIAPEITLAEESVVEDNIIDINKFLELNRPETESKFENPNIMDIKDYQKQEEIPEPEFQTAKFDELKDQLIDLRKQLSDELNFNDLIIDEGIEKSSEGMGRAA